MSIGEILHPPNESPPYSKDVQGGGEKTDLQEKYSFTPLLPKLRSALDELGKSDTGTVSPVNYSGARPSAPLLDRLGNNVLQLQESFTERLYDTMQEWGIDVSAKLTLRLDDEASLCVEGEHPENDRIKEMLLRFPEYSDMFAEIAVQSAMLRDLKNLWIMTMYDKVRDSYAALAASNLRSHYQISLKGEMNHFYFTK